MSVLKKIKKTGQKKISSQTDANLTSFYESEVHTGGTINEDAFFHDDNLKLYVIADGMGGYEFGQDASSLVVKSIKSIVKEKTPQDVLLGTQDVGWKSFLAHAVSQANVKLCKTASDRKAPMGSTATAVLIRDNHLYCAHVGDCRLYVIDGNLTPKVLTREHRAGGAGSNLLERSLGKSLNVACDTLEIELPGCYSFILCTDGVWSFVPQDKLSEIIQSKPKEEVAGELVRYAVEQGSEDDVTAIYIESANMSQYKEKEDTEKVISEGLKEPQEIEKAVVHPEEYLPDIAKDQKKEREIPSQLTESKESRRLKREKEASAQERNALINQINQLKAEIDNLNKQVQRLKNENKRLQSENEHLSEEISDKAKIFKLEPRQTQTKRILAGITVGIILAGIVIGISLNNARQARTKQATKAVAGTKTPAQTTKPVSGKLQSEFTNSIGIKFVLIKAGEFMMGSPSNENGRDNDETQHRVTITKDFYIGAHEVTNEQFRRFRSSHDSKTYEGYSLNEDKQPVAYVSWDDAIAFCEWLSGKEGKRYRLPTEVEWEYACRAGTTTRYYFGDDEAMLGEYTWYSGNSGKKTHQVGTKEPNARGIYDMHGNVWEWCNSGGDKVVRSGSWRNNPDDLRCANRYRLAQDNRSNHVGFRCVMTP